MKQCGFLGCAIGSEMSLEKINEEEKAFAYVSRLWGEMKLKERCTLSYVYCFRFTYLSTKYSLYYDTYNKNVFCIKNLTINC